MRKLVLLLVIIIGLTILGFVLMGLPVDEAELPPGGDVDEYGLEGDLNLDFYEIYVDDEFPYEPVDTNTEVDPDILVMPASCEFDEYSSEVGKDSEVVLFPEEVVYTEYVCSVGTAAARVVVRKFQNSDAAREAFNFWAGTGGGEEVGFGQKVIKNELGEVYVLNKDYFLEMDGYENYNIRGEFVAAQGIYNLAKQIVNLN